MFLSRRGYHLHVNCIKPSDFILTFEYLYLLFNKTLNNWGLATVSRALLTQSSSHHISGGSNMGWTRGMGLETSPPSQPFQQARGVNVSAHLPHRILVWLISQYLHSSVKTLWKYQLWIIIILWRWLGVRVCMLIQAMGVSFSNHGSYLNALPIPYLLLCGVFLKDDGKH